MTAIVGSSLALPALLPAQVVIQGEVSAEGTGAPVVGANVVVKGTGQGGATDVGGKFRFVARAAYPLTLEITHIAYQSREVVLAADTSLVIVLVPHLIRGEDVVITGEKSRAAADVSSAVELVTARTIEALGARDVGDALRPLPSVTITASATGKQTISIRGSNSNEVTVFLDGMRLNDSNTGVADLSAIDLNDLQQVQVVKGGATTLFGPGAFGGVVSMTTRQPDSNRVALVRSYGLTDAVDQDLGASASGRLGPLAVGGHFSGKSRLYDGSVVYTNLFNSIAAAVYMRPGNFSTKRYQMNNLLELPSGEVSQSDHTTLNILSYNGAVLGVPDWSFFAGTRDWGWQDRFFTNLERNLAEASSTARIVKQINNRWLSSTLQLDIDDQSFTGENLVAEDLGSSVARQSSRLARTDLGYSAVFRLISDDVHPLASRIRWEFGLRGDRIDTRHYQELLSSRPAGEGVDTLSFQSAQHDRQDVSLTRRLGVHLEGSAPHLYYTFFMNQGRNQRLPSLNDLFLWANSDLPDVLAQPLKQEFLSTTDLGMVVFFRPPGYSPTQLEFKVVANLFLNHYANKVTYRFSTDRPPVPLNTLSTRISGYDLSLQASLWDKRLRVQWAYLHINLDDPLVFPNKPEYRLTYQFELSYPWLSVLFDFYRDGPQFVLFNSVLTASQIKERQSANLNIVLRRRLWRANLSLAYSVRNIFSDEPVFADPSVGATGLPFQYFEVHRRILTLRIRL